MTAPVISDPVEPVDDQTLPVKLLQVVAGGQPGLAGPMISVSMCCLVMPPTLGTAYLATHRIAHPIAHSLDEVIHPWSSGQHRPGRRSRPQSTGLAVSTAPGLSVDGETPSRSTATRPSRSGTATDTGAGRHCGWTDGRDHRRTRPSLGFATVVSVEGGLELEDLFVDPDAIRQGFARAYVCNQ